MSEANVEGKPAAKPNKLFRAIVVLGTALTAGQACDGEDCCEPLPIDSSVAQGDAAQHDAGVGDAPVDVVLIL